ncbi:glycosyl transferase family 2 [Ruminiclostridium sufflavum DSM 19573]|uniref:Glycosyl transferase family 2 n=1 Tax=Ruminiclostridium sufflavum DSM 19573 TaxID=1121337 RepID=A0A318XQ60_9FIRM|nr:glycosyltransferase [Ruminiclostridium sufflavum]PYG87949.1 glycosyl transferase family 2 [Ruminiclostridium sufflavum DSM 19573]
MNEMHTQGDMQPLASIIIPTYNQSRLLKYTVDSILKQSVDTRLLQVIVVDDGSSDDTREMVKNYFSKLNFKYFYQEDMGFRAAKARNTGILNADAPLCIFVDSSVMLGTHAVEEHLKIYRCSSRPSAVIGYVYGFDDYNRNENSLLELVDVQNADSSIEKLKKLGICDNREPLYLKHGDNLSKWPAPWVIFWTCHVSVPRAALIKAGLFDEFYTSWGGEDSDLALALERNNVRFVMSRAAESIHYPHAKNSGFYEAFDEAFMEKKHRMDKKYNTAATRLWLTTACEELNEKLIELGQKGQ